ncbi:hypothetical protein ES705_06299 [subsurface metagenome]|nr:PQQ-binding-like beta-propeller repeat protein [Clostridia bacterium]
MRKKILMLAAFTFLGTTTLLGMGRRLEGALNPTLLWEKEFDGVVVEEGVGLARISGDAIVSLKESGAEQIDKVLIFNTIGQPVVQEWKNACYGRISDDGNKVIYLTPYSADSFYDKVHYATKDGQEIWWKQHGGDAHISPDGNLVIEASTAMESTQLIEVYDATGKEVWSYKLGESIDVIFSPDSDYIIANSSTFPDKNRQSRVYKSQTGELLWKKEDEWIMSVSKDILYLVGLKGLYDREGNMIFDKGTIVSEDGKKLIVCYSKKIELISLPEKTVLETYPVKTKDFGFSYDGKCLAVIGERTDVTSTNNLFVIDTETDEIWETKIEPKGKSEFNQMQIFLTKDGKHILIQAEGKLYYYKVY